MNYQERIDKLTADYLSNFKNQSSEILNYKSDSNEWSILQIIAHVNKLNRSYFPIFEEVQQGKFSTPIIGNFTFFAKYLGRKILESVKVENRKKVKTSHIWKPKDTFEVDDLFNDFEDMQSSLKTYIVNMDKWIKRDLIIHSPASKNIVYPLSKALEIIIIHEQRHFHQAINQLKKSSPSYV